MKRGDTGSDVFALQAQLLTFGFSPGKIDGNFGFRTDAAVRAFQASRGLAVDGIVGPATSAALVVHTDEPSKTMRPSEVPKVLTALTDSQIVEALSLGHSVALGTLPSTPRLALGWCLVALENAHGRALWCNDFGNITAFGGWPGSFYVIRVSERVKRNPDVWELVDMKFRAYPDSTTGAADLWRLLAGRYASALVRFDAGDAVGAAYALSGAGYFTAHADQYSKTMAALYQESGKVLQG